MTFAEILLIAVAVAMDCFTMSIVCGMTLGRGNRPVIFKTAFLFGLFQAMMPLIGWLCTSSFQKYLEAYDHWIAFGMLAFLGIRMIREAFSEDEENDKGVHPERLSDRLMLAVATSIDALAVGISFSCTGYTTISQLTLPLFTIGIVSFAFSIAGAMIGIRFGSAIMKKIKPELIGGIILIIIGIRILIEHLCGI